MRGRAAVFAAVVALTLAGAVPSSADEVTVSLTNPGGSRTLYVESVLGQPLSSLDFGTGRSQPFRVRVVDTTMERSGFQVLTTMSNLYMVSGSTYAWDEVISSSEVGIAYPANPLNLLNVKAVVAPVYDVADTLTGTLCTTVTAAGGSCSIAMSALDGVRQTVDLAVDLADLNSLPLVPQAGEEGEFVEPDFAGIGADDPEKPGSFTPTNKRVISGVVSTASSTLTKASAALHALVADEPASALVDADTLGGALRTAMGATVYDALPSAVIDEIVAGLDTTVQALTADGLVGQSGTYLSYPQLDVNVPTDAAPGSYQGTLVVTAVQL